MEVLKLIAEGRTNFEIAQALGISLEGAKYHVREIMSRLQVDSRDQAAAAWRAEHDVMRRSVRRLRRTMGFAFARWSLTTAAVSTVTIGGAIAVGLMLVAGGSGGPSAEPVTTSTTGAVVDTPTATATPTRTVAPPSPTPSVFGPYPLGTRTGDPVIDAVLAAVEAGDAGALLNLIHYAPVPCANPQGSAAPAPPGTFLCPNGQPDGTGIPAVRTENGGVHPEGDAIVADLVEAFFLNLADPRVHAIVEESPNLQAGERSIVFASGEALIVDADGIAAILFFATNQPENRLASARSFVLPPLPSDPADFAEALREELSAAASEAELSFDATSGYGIFDAWTALAPPVTVVPATDEPSGREVSAIAIELERDQQSGYTHAVYFAVLDDNDNCAPAGMLITIPPGDPDAGFITLTLRALPAGALCTAEAVLATGR